MGFLLLPGVAWATTYTVTSTTDAVDANPGNNVCATAGAVCTLRAAVQEANAHNGADAISIPAGTFTLALAGAGEDLAATGDLDLVDPVTITGAGATSTIISANRIDRVFDIFVGASPVALSNLTVSDGFSGLGQLAGGIWNSASLTLNGVQILDCEGRLGGGGILNDNTLTASDLTISGCSTNSQGAALYNTATATLTRATLSGNISAASGGGIKNDDTLTLTNVTLSGNTAGTDGGGLCNIDVAAATLKNVTIANNSANRGWALFSSGDLTVTNVIVADSTSGENCAGAGSVTSGGGNLDTTTSGTTCGFSGTGDLVGMAALLGALGDNGGPTQTHLLLPASPAIDAGKSCPPPATDQRGVTRPVGVACDIGAVERQATDASTTTSSTTNTVSTTSSSTTSSTLPSSTTTSSTSTSSTTTSSTSTSTSSTTSTSQPGPTSTTSSSTTTSTSTSSTTTSSTSTSTSSTTSTSQPGATSTTSSSTSTSTSSTTTSSTSTSTSSTTSTSQPGATSTTSSSTTTSTSTTNTLPTTSTSTTSSTLPSSTSTLPTTTTTATSTTTSTTLAGLVPGGPLSKSASDCYLELLVAGVENGTATVEDNRKVLCIDGDPCDLGPCGDGVCALRAALCVNQLDPNLADCTPPAGGLVKVRVRNAIDLEAPGAITEPGCSASVDFSVEARFNKAGKYLAKKSREKLKGKAVAAKGTKPRSDVDTWIVQCAPRLTDCPATP